MSVGEHGPAMEEEMLTQKGRERGAVAGEESAVGAPIGVESLRGRATCSIEEASRILQIARSTAYAAARDGSLPTLRLSHRLLVPTAKLLEMLGVEVDDQS
jgi:hypothetical protein